MTAEKKIKKDAGTGKRSAGILVYRRNGVTWEVLLGHPGGPFWKNKDRGAWTIPKGEPEADETLIDAAIREFSEETGWKPAVDSISALSPVKQKAGKWIHSWSIAAFRPADELASNHFQLEWPPHSGRVQSFPEIDRFSWLSFDQAKEMINPAQRALLDELEKKLADS